jgi:hypothetical protein
MKNSTASGSAVKPTRTLALAVLMEGLWKIYFKTFDMPFARC